MIDLRKKSLIGFCFAAFAVCSFVGAGADSFKAESGEASVTDQKDNAECDGTEDAQVSSGSDVFSGLYAHLGAGVSYDKNTLTLSDNSSKFGVEAEGAGDAIPPIEFKSLDGQTVMSKSKAGFRGTVTVGYGRVFQDRLYAAIEACLDLGSKNKSKKTYIQKGWITSEGQDPADRKINAQAKNKGFGYGVRVKIGSKIGETCVAYVGAGFSGVSNKYTFETSCPQLSDDGFVTFNKSFTVRKIVPSVLIGAEKNFGSTWGAGVEVSYNFDSKKTKKFSSVIKDFESEFEGKAKAKNHSLQTKVFVAFYPNR